MVDLTPAAIEAISKHLLKRGTPRALIRLGVKGGGCSGLSYVIEYAEEAGPKDLTFEFGEIRVVVDKKSLSYLKGTTLDFEKSLMKQGFKFRNPNEGASCGCGNSFSVQ